VLVIAGAANPRDFWSKIATQGVQNRIIEKGVLGEQELQDVYAACDLLIHPTREDTFGMVVLEAMANALPVIVSGAQYCGISSELTDAKTALILSDPEDPEELAGKVVLALQGHMKESLSTQGQSWAKTQDWKKMAELQNTVYTHIAYHLGEQAPAVK
jgi:UDP-glucose:(heptosyl)LPS alpha-1,3-glucosyltransferase